MQTSRIFFAVICLLLPLSTVAQEKAKSPSLQKLHQAIAKLVGKHYPRATSYYFEQTIGFEHSTRVYVTKLVSKYPKGLEQPIGLVRGPMDDGVWCQVWYRSGDMNDEPAYQRGEGAMKREFFTEHLYYANDRQKKGHLVVTLRLPLKTTREQRQFIKELRELLNQFGEYLPAKSG